MNYFEVVTSDFVPLNPANFLKMAHGDPAGLRELAFDYFNDTRRQLASWVALHEAGNFRQLRDELHRCKGGASIFGLERIVAMIGAVESPSVLESRGFDFGCFEMELGAAENSVMAMTD